MFLFMSPLQRKKIQRYFGALTHFHEHRVSSTYNLSPFKRLKKHDIEKN